jgi:hypothetical protein
MKYQFELELKCVYEVIFPFYEGSQRRTMNESGLCERRSDLGFVQHYRAQDPAFDSWQDHYIFSTYT